MRFPIDLDNLAGNLHRANSSITVANATFGIADDSVTIDPFEKLSSFLQIEPDIQTGRIAADNFRPVQSNRRDKRSVYFDKFLVAQTADRHDDGTGLKCS